MIKTLFLSTALVTVLASPSINAQTFMSEDIRKQALELESQRKLVIEKLKEKALNTEEHDISTIYSEHSETKEDVFGLSELQSSFRLKVKEGTSTLSGGEDSH